MNHLFLQRKKNKANRDYLKFDQILKWYKNIMLKRSIEEIRFYAKKRSHNEAINSDPSSGWHEQQIHTHTKFDRSKKKTVLV